MGTIIHRSRKINFNRLSGIVYAYKTSFGNTATRIFADNPEIHALEAIRHLLVHRAGRVDKPFQDRMKKSDWSSLKLNEQFPVDTKVAVDYSNAVGRTGVELIQFVNEWLENNPE